MRTKDPETGKSVIVCDKCGVELAWNELAPEICFVCRRNRDDKENEKERRAK